MNRLGVKINLTCICMHIYNHYMRTTIELKKEHHGALIRIASRRGLKGFSRIVQEAIDFFLAHEGNAQKEDRIKQALSSEGVLNEDEANQLTNQTKSIRDSWRS
jgi:hypothetical protein